MNGQESTEVHTPHGIHELEVGHSKKQKPF